MRHEVEISEPSFMATLPDTPAFPYGARCTCGWTSKTDTDRKKVAKAATKHVEDTQNRA